MVIQVTAIKRADLREEDASLLVTLANDIGDECTLELPRSLIETLSGLAGMAAQALSEKGAPANAMSFKPVAKMVASTSDDAVNVQVTDSFDEIHEFRLNEDLATGFRQDLRKSIEAVRGKRADDAAEFDGPLAKLLAMRKSGQIT